MIADKYGLTKYELAVLRSMVTHNNQSLAWNRNTRWSCGSARRMEETLSLLGSKGLAWSQLGENAYSTYWLTSAGIAHALGRS